MRSLPAFVFLSFALVACGGSSEPPTAPTTSAAAPVLTLGEVKIEAPKGTGGLHSDGRVEVGGKTVLTLTSDGRALDDKGAEITHIDKDGKVGTRGLSIGDDGTVKAPDGQVAMQLGADGIIAVAGKATPMKVTATDPRTRRAVMFAFVVLHAGGSVTSTTGPGCPAAKGAKSTGGPGTCGCEDTNQGKKYELACDDATGCVCKTDGKQTATVPGAKDICTDQSVWSKCGFPAHPETMTPNF